MAILRAANGVIRIGDSLLREGVVAPEISLVVDPMDIFTMSVVSKTASIGNDYVDFSFNNVSFWSMSPMDMKYNVKDFASNTVGEGTVADVQDGAATWSKRAILTRNVLSGDKLTVMLSSAI
jgi:hypothetical protein